MNRKAVGILGGTFDPVHYAHLRLALDVYEHYGLDEIRLLPCKIPAHKDTPHASEMQRVAMLKLAIANEPAFKIDTRELERVGPSYMVDTLMSLRTEIGIENALCLIMGLDAFLSLPSWHRYEALIDLAHIIVMHRPGYELGLEGEMADLYREHRALSLDQLKDQPAGLISLYSARSLAISASEIREKIRKRQSLHYLLPDSVWDYIEVQGLYLSNH